MNRRKFLKIVGAAGALAVVPLISSKKDDFDFTSPTSWDDNGNSILDSDLDIDMVTLTGCEITMLSIDHDKFTADMNAEYVYGQDCYFINDELMGMKPLRHTMNFELRNLAIRDNLWILDCEVGKTLTIQMTKDKLAVW